MKRSLQFVQICLVSVLLFSCRLILIADTGGSIETVSGSYDCVGQCTVDVVDNFNETFIATADNGYEFVGWGDDGLCAEFLLGDCPVIILGVLAELFPFDLIVHALFVAVPPVAGYWDLTQYVDETDCDEGTSVDTRVVEMSIQGDKLSIYDSGIVFEDTLVDRTLTVDFVYPEDGGLNTSKLTVTFSEDYQTLEGAVTWFWTDGMYSCSGVDEVEGVKQQDDG